MAQTEQDDPPRGRHQPEADQPIEEDRRQGLADVQSGAPKPTHKVPSTGPSPPGVMGSVAASCPAP